LAEHLEESILGTERLSIIYTKGFWERVSRVPKVSDNKDGTSTIIYKHISFVVSNKSTYQSILDRLQKELEKNPLVT
jgi:hypothetical protein